MTDKADVAVIKNFFGGTFHEDWDLEGSNAREVISLYLEESGATLERCGELSSAIESYVRQFKNDEELEERLFRELGCYYRPSVDGLSTRQWLHGIAEQLVNRPHR